MKKYLILFVTILSVAAFVGCSSDEDDFTPPNYVTFEAEEMNFTVNQNSSDSFDVAVYTANTTGSDRTFSISIDESSSLDAENYSIPETVTVPANTNKGILAVEITDASIDPAGETLVLNLNAETGLYVGEALAIDVFKLCEFTSLAPSYIASVSAFGGAAPGFEMVLTSDGGNVFTSDSLWGMDFIAWATGDSSYSGFFVYSGTITLNSDNTIKVESGDDFMEGGSGNYNPCTGTFSYTLETTVFGDPVFVDVVLTPNE